MDFDDRDSLLRKVLSLDTSYHFLAGEVLDKFEDSNDAVVADDLQRLAAISKNARDLVGKNILDLGCGSIVSPDIVKGSVDDGGLRIFEPWYPRIAHLAGADVLGVDIAPNMDEKFEWLRRDLTEDRFFMAIPDASYHAVNNDFFTMPADSGFSVRGTSPTLMSKVSGDLAKAWNINDKIFKHVGRILMEGGVYTLAETRYVKKNGVLVKDGEIYQVPVASLDTAC